MTVKKLKIAYVIDDLGYGGAQRQLSVLLRGMTGSAEPHVYCLSGITHPFSPAIGELGVGVTVLARSHGFDVKRLAGLAGGLTAQGADIVHGFLGAANIYAFLAARRTGLPCVLSLRSDRITFGGIREWCLRAFYRRADRVTVNSEAGARYLRDAVAVNRERIAIIPNAVAPAPDTARDDSEALPFALDGPVIGFVGRLTGLKRVDLLLEAFAVLVKSTPRTTLVIVGDGPEKQRLRDLADRRGIADRVIMTGAVDNVDRFTKRFSCLVLPSGFEGFPNAVVEALALGVPVVTTRVGDLENIVIPGQTGYLLDDDSPSALASLIACVLSDESLRRRVRETGPALIRANYSIDAAAGKLLAVYNGL